LSKPKFENECHKTCNQKGRENDGTSENGKEKAFLVGDHLGIRLSSHLFFLLLFLFGLQDLGNAVVKHFHFQRGLVFLIGIVLLFLETVVHFLLQIQFVGTSARSSGVLIIASHIRLLVSIFVLSDLLEIRMVT